MKKLLLLLVTTFIFSSCGVLPKKDNYYIANSTVELGVVGEKQNSIRKTSFQTFGIPEFEEKIKLSVLAKPFTKETYKDYLKVIQENQLSNTVNYNDSIQPAPTFLEVTIDDRVSAIRLLNNNNNKAVFNYLRKSPKATLVSTIRLAGDSNLQSQLLNADGVYLKTDEHKKQWLHIFKNQKEVGKVDFKNATVFSYQLASFCWERTKNRKIQLATLNTKGQKCVECTTKSSEEMNKKIIEDSLKF